MPGVRSKGRQTTGNKGGLDYEGSMKRSLNVFLQQEKAINKQKQRY